MDYNREDQVWCTVWTINQCSACYHCIWWRTELVFLEYLREYELHKYIRLKIHHPIFISNFPTC